MALDVKRNSGPPKPRVGNAKSKALAKNDADKRKKPNLAVEMRKRLALSQPVFARLLPVSVRTLVTLEGGSPTTEAVMRRLKEIDRLTEALSEVMKKESLGTWLQNPNQAFDGLKPLEVIERGEIDRLWSMVYFLRSGVAV